LTADSQLVTGNTEQTQPENRVFFPALDGLRAIALLMVFFQHYAAIPWGWTGVNVFFVLSGFLITGILYDTRNDPHRARNFYIRRTLRIFPLYYGIFVVLLVLGPLIHWRWTWSWIAWPLYLGNFLILRSPAVLQSSSPQAAAAYAWLSSARFPATTLYLGHFWSLCVEEQFYLIWPWIVFWVRSRRALLWICGVTVVVVPLLRVIAQHTAPAWMLQAELLYRVTPFQVDSLLLGGLIALLWRGAHRERLLAVGRIVAALCAVVALVYLAITIRHCLPAWRLGYLYPEWKLTWGLSFVDVFSAAIILCCLQPAGVIYRLLHLRPLRWLGRISYGAYVFHDIPHHIYENAIALVAVHVPRVAAHKGPASTVLALVCTVLLSWLSFTFFESRFLNLKERWTIRAAV
jgi:peptidoglycan/LPS O-acetylase OafA/YrhL